MAIPESIKKLANDIRTKIYGRDVRESLAKGIEEAGNIADEANKQVNSIQDQVNQLVVNGDSSVEAAQARVSANGVVYSTLKERLDKTIILSSSEPDKAEFWYEDKGEAPVNFNPDSGVSVINAVTSDNPPSDNSKLWFDVEEA
ncbi:hypothetical protein LI012_06490 [Caldibacillus thermoamylovorans]|uniref:hypothetical protein n=1 Tax=Caldibacillus thermoamylovorans TaxID=35841 RepID=UPI001D08923C|nr:hypothetical protein [Caldibacillus thermoamylovorans]MCB5934501.1 hypothetical protein [Bacillus sp. DFI.2.34]MCB7076476.1 hypothetical protein [Caldibacillus thermoamylovorans]